MLLVNDDATVAGFSGTEKQRSLLFKLLSIRYRPLELERFLFPFYDFFSFSFSERNSVVFEFRFSLKDGVGGVLTRSWFDELEMGQLTELILALFERRFGSVRAIYIILNIVFE